MKYLLSIIAAFMLFTTVPANASHRTINVATEQRDLVAVCNGDGSSNKIIALKNDIETMGNLNTIAVKEAAENRGCGFDKFKFIPIQILCVFSRDNTSVFVIASATIGDSSVDYIIANQRTNAIYPACTDEILAGK